MALPIDGNLKLKVRFTGSFWGKKFDRTVDFPISLLRGHAVPHGGTIREVPVIKSINYFVLEGELEGTIQQEITP